MRAGLRLGIGLSAAALALGSLPARAQESGEAATNTPAADAIGPRELQNFSIDGRVTRPADEQPATRAPTPPRAVPPANANRVSTEQPRPAATGSPAAATRQDAPASPPAVSRAEPPRRTSPSASVTVPLPGLVNDRPVAGTRPSTVAASSDFVDDPQTGITLAPEHKLPMWPWLLAALALGAGGVFVFWRNRSRPVLAGGPAGDAFVAPEPESQRALAPRSAPSPPSAIPGLVSTRLRPWIDFGFEPLRCVLDDDQLVMEFELELLNSGSAAARAVLVEATLFNAGPDQDGEIARFFGKPVGEGERIVSIQPMKRVTLRPRVVIAREHLRIFDAGDRKVFVPLIAFNALYRWTSGEGQSSISYLIGRDTKGEKLAPFRADLGPRVFRGLAARPLPLGVRK